MGVLGGVFVLKSGLRILIRAPQVPFSVPPKRPKWVFLAIGPRKSDFWPFYFLGHFPIEIPIEAKKIVGGLPIELEQKQKLF